MKIRLGFVSNSSSASYTVTIHKTFESRDQLLHDLYESSWCAISECEEDHFNSMLLLEMRWPKSKTTITTSPFDNVANIRPPREHRATSEHGDHPYIDDEAQQVATVQYILEQEGIEVHDVGNGRFKLSYFSSMHNSFNDMNHLLQDIYFEYLVNGGATFEWKDES